MTKRNWRGKLGDKVLLFLYYWVFIYLENISDDNLKLVSSCEIGTKLNKNTKAEGSIYFWHNKNDKTAHHQKKICLKCYRPAE
jgi:hypothetical protein